MSRRSQSGAKVVPITNRHNDPWTAARAAVLTWDTADALPTAQARVHTQHRAGAQAIGVLRVLLATHDKEPSA